jgi:hypothetical protein
MLQECVWDLLTMTQAVHLEGFLTTLNLAFIIGSNCYPRYQVDEQPDKRPLGWPAILRIPAEWFLVVEQSMGSLAIISLLWSGHC